MELYVNDAWTQCYGDFYVAEAVAWSESGNHATIYATGMTAEGVNTRLLDALRELWMAPEEPARDVHPEREGT